MSYLLAGDVGGTKTIVALADAGGPPTAIVTRRLYASRDFDSLEALLEDFLSSAEVPRARDIAAACFSVAGPVVDGGTTLTNLRWRMAADALSARLGAPVTLINDFSAAGLGVLRLPPDDLAVLQAARPRERGVRVIVGAGTGLGVGWLTWRDGRYVAHPSEAGHVDFAPLDELQDRLLAWLRRSFPRVSAERVISGPGLLRIYTFLREVEGGIPGRELAEALAQRPDAPEVIGEFAAANRDPLAVRALDLFVSAYGAYTGDMALATLAHGGVYVAGGIAPRILRKLEDGAFMRAFLNKGRYRELLGTMPVHVVLNPQAGLYGALAEAAGLASKL